MSIQFNGARLRAFREAAGISAERLAIIIYPSAHTIEALELGLAQPSRGTIARIAAALGIEPIELLDRHEEVAP
jgi:transcriptional regulator with XRE-family HTH domain